MKIESIDAIITPDDSLNILSKTEVNRLRDRSLGGLYMLFRRCVLAVLKTGSDTDDPKEVLDVHQDFKIEVIEQDRGIQLALYNAPISAFVDGELIKGIKEHVFSVLRDLLYVDYKISNNPDYDLTTSFGVTNVVFHILRNARIFKARMDPNLVVCWGGHSINREEYDYSKRVGYSLGLRGMDICTGCGPGAMKGPMKGATIAHAKQRVRLRRYVGFTEPGIIAAEPPNPIVTELVILPDIEKRLEAFVRGGHGIVVFPGGAGTAEEILYLLGILLHPNNKNVPFPFIFTGPEASRAYFERIDAFIGQTLGKEAQDLYDIIIDDPEQVARIMRSGLVEVKGFRKTYHDAYYYNWRLHIDADFQMPFSPTHEAVAALDLSLEQPAHILAANLRRAFSAIVAGNVKEEGLSEIAKNGPFKIHSCKELLGPLDELLQSFVAQGRMKLHGDYVPCYEVVT